MPRVKLSLPHERTKVKLKSTQMQLRVRIAEHKERLNNINQQLAAMQPKRKPTETA